MTTQDDLVDFLKNPENAQMLNGLVEDIRYALIDYQVRTLKTLPLIIPNTCPRPRYNRTSTTRVVKR